MSQLRGLGNENEQAVHREEVRESMRPSLLLLILVSVVLFFFFLPLFASLRMKGVLLWLLALMIFSSLIIAKLPKRVVYVLTRRSLCKMHAGTGRPLWQIPLKDIRDIHVVGDSIRIAIPKKTYVLYNAGTRDVLLQRLISLTPQR